MAVTGSAIFEVVISGRTRLMYYDRAHYDGVMNQDDRKRRGVTPPFRRCQSQCVNELHTRYCNFDITAIF
jgi:hypothetical protein